MIAPSILEHQTGSMCTENKALCLTLCSRCLLAEKVGDQIRYQEQNLAWALTYNKKINFDELIIEELVGRLLDTPQGKDIEIFLPRFIQTILNFKNDKFNEFSGINKSKIVYSKPMSKVLFGTLDSRIMWM